jgi:amino acid transporter
MNLGSLGYVSSIGVSLSYFACTLGSMNAGARVLYSMARRNQFAPGFGIAHPVNATPSRGIILLAALGIVIPVSLLLLRVSLSDCINYVTQLTSYGFISSYFLVCLSLPFYLYRRELLHGIDVIISAAALLILTVVLGLSVFPVPDAPWRYLPYLFFLFLIAGTGISWRYLRRNSATNEEISEPDPTEEISNLV